MSISVREFLDSASYNPVIPIAKTPEWVPYVKQADNQIVYLTCGTILDVEDMVRDLHRVGKKVIVHAELIEGLAVKDVSVDFLASRVKADGIISTRANQIRHARELGLLTIQRFYVIDVKTYRNVEKHLRTSDPDIMEFMPAGLDKGLKYLIENISKPVVASGMVLDKDDVIHALNAGAVAVATSNRSLWDC